MSGKNKWFAIFVIAIFIFSTFSIMLYTDNSSTDDSTTKTVDVTNQLSLNYVAEVNGIISEYPMKGYFILQGITQDSLINNLDSQIQDINNVYNVTSSMQMLDSNVANLNEISYIYTAKIVGSDLDYFALQNALFDKNIFGEFLVYPSAIVDFNSFVVFKNNDMNLTKEYDLGSTQLTVLMHPEKYDNQIGDNIKFNISATFSGDVLSNYGTEQSGNISANPLTINSIYSSDYNKLAYTIYVLNADRNFSESDFKFIKDLGYDYNYLAQSNNAKLDFELNTKFDNVIKDANAKLYDFNANVLYTIDSLVYVDSINYMDKNYSIDQNVNIYSDFSGKSYPGLNYLIYKDSNVLQYNISAYLLRDKIVNVNAEAIGKK